jgi:hypothetical protein
MGKLAQYRFLKKVKRMLDTPVKNEDTYDVSSSPMYIGDKSSHDDQQESNPNHSLRRTQVSDITSMLLQQISRMEKLQQIGHDAMNDDENSAVIDKTFIDIAILFAELEAAMLFTEAEKAHRRQQLARLDLKLHSGPDIVGNDVETLPHLRLQIEDWQIENTRKQRKLSRIETTIRDLGLNVNDVRCTQILREKKDAVAALEAAITAGARLCRQTWKKLEGMFAEAKEK